MEGELLDDSSSTFPTKQQTFTEIMEEYFPVYLDAGMTYGQYWDDDMDLVIPYRKAMERRREWQNQTLWLQGLYIYNALTAVMPALSVKSKATVIEPYMEHPIPLTEKSKREYAERKEREEFEKNLLRMQARMASINARFKKKTEGIT